MKNLLEYNKRIATVKDFIRYYFSSAYNLKRFIFAKEKYLDAKFMERIMLAVTEVNGCKVCAQGHAKMALESGLSEIEIQELLSNEQDKVPKHEGVGILYATHFADTDGNVGVDVTKRLYDTYEENEANAIIATIHMIMLGNVLGIAFGCFKDRFKGKFNKDSSLLRELLIFLLFIILFPIYLVVSVLGRIFNR
jgi:AhpD family alkylhydroperoxidase